MFPHVLVHPGYARCKEVVRQPIPKKSFAAVCENSHSSSLTFYGLLWPFAGNSSPTIIFVPTFMLTSSCTSSFAAYGIAILTTCPGGSPALLHLWHQPP